MELPEPLGVRTRVDLLGVVPETVSRLSLRCGGMLYRGGGFALGRCEAPPMLQPPYRSIRFVTMVCAAGILLLAPHIPVASSAAVGLPPRVNVIPPDSVLAIETPVAGPSHCETPVHEAHCPTDVFNRSNSGMTGTFHAARTIDDPWLAEFPSTHPPPLSGAAMVFDASDGYDLAFGGGTGAESGAISYHTVNWTYSYNSTANVWTNLTTGVAPPASDQWAMAYDRTDGYVVAFGGGTNQTWKFHDGAWSQLFTLVSPPARDLPCLTFDSEDSYVLLFGGSSSTGGASLGDTWSFENGVWVNRTVDVAPPAGYGCNLQDEPSDHRVIEFGGVTNPTSATIPDENQTWSYLGGTWTNLTSPVAPVGRWGAMMSYLGPCGCVVLFGGFFYYGNSSSSGEGLRGDTWLLEGNNWTRPTVSSAPGMRGTAAFAFDPTVEKDVMFGGFSYSGNSEFNDTWTFGDPLSIALGPGSLPSLDAGRTANLSVVSTGGVAPVSFRWSGLPAICAQTSGLNVTCTASSPLSANVSVEATDADDFQAATAFDFQVFSTPSVSTTTTTNRTDVGIALQFRSAETGGAGGGQFTWKGLTSGLGCSPPFASSNASEVNCTPSTAAQYDVSSIAMDVTGDAESSPVLIIAVAPSLNVSKFTASPSSVGAGSGLRISATITGGTPPLSYNYSGLPPGCVTENQSTFECDPSSTGTFAVRLSVQDRVGGRTNGTVNVTVGPASSEIFGLSATEELELFGGGAAVVVILVATVLVIRRRGRPPPS
jgi:hypothetical protein